MRWPFPARISARANLATLLPIRGCRRMEPDCIAAPVPLARQTACTTWGEVFDAVQSGDAQFGVLPFENSNAGDVSHCAGSAVHPPGHHHLPMCDLPIRQDLLAVPGQRCRPSARSSAIRRRWPRAAFSCSSTALKPAHGATRPDAARHVAELKDPTVAAIASAETAGLYGLQILCAGINADGDNTTSSS